MFFYTPLLILRKPKTNCKFQGPMSNVLHNTPALKLHQTLTMIYPSIIYPWLQVPIKCKIIIKQEKTSLTRSNDKNPTICLRGSSDHILDEISVPRSINDSHVELGGLKLPERDINSDSAFTFRLQFVKDPGVLEGTLPHLHKM